jgi:predicted negative regulator of RcsB-dependent stress response
MAYDLEEQEQIATLKAWWNQYGNVVSWLLIIACAGYAAWSGWNYYLRNQSTQASQLYEELQRGVLAKDNVRVLRAATDMEDRFGRTAYAQMSGLAAAKSAFDANDLKAARAQLQWVVDHATDDEYKAVARLRLAGVLLDEKGYDEGLKLLAAEFPPSFAGEVANRRGDIFVAQNKMDEARAAYQQALEKIDAKSPGRQLIQLKLEAAGGSAPKA